MSKWQCPYAIRNNAVEFLLCKIMQKENVNYFDPKNAITACCAYQFHCNCSNRVENTEGAKECYRYQTQQKG
uniref:Uncharacterized protein n=1 Tax=Siphoviridae sp. ctnMR5 TaxID=2825658 RepID=A0A8S5U8U5_9CAUD|nr:MAG TPA: hypothetical protein [Siphoviridae sp. ctnMR5]